MNRFAIWLAAGMATISALILLVWPISEQSVVKDGSSPQDRNLSDLNNGHSRLSAIFDTTDSDNNEFELDKNRLFDKAYEADPDLVAFAEANDLSAACVVAVAKNYYHKIDVPDHACPAPGVFASNTDIYLLPGEYEEVCHTVREDEICRRIKTQDHPYEKYSDDELKSLSLSSPEAAVILARRTEDDSASIKYYERAVALSGKPGPLEEWMMHRDTGGIVHINGLLDTEKAKIGFEIYLTIAALGGSDEPAKEYARLLSQNNIDIEPIKKLAAERVASITAQRRALVGDGSGV
jgi:hypothetical protein